MTIREILVALGFKVDENSKDTAEKSVQNLKNFASKVLGTIAVVFSVQKLSAFAQDCVQAASDVEEMENKFDVVFDGINEEVDQWAGNFADAIGRNKNTIKTYLADQQNLLVGFGMTREEGAKLAEDMTSLALDLASFANTDETMTVNNMTKAVMGETEAARALDAVLNDNTRAETMAAMGLSGKYDKLDQLTKMQVNYNAILRQSPDAVGDCIRSADSYEAAQRRLNASQEYFKESVGKQLIPIYKTLTNWKNAAVKAATKLAQAILGTTEENNHLLHAFERIQALVKRLQPAMERFAKSVKAGAVEVANRVKAVADRFGGFWNLFKMLSAVAGAFFLIMKWGKVIAAAKAFMTFLKGINALFGVSNLKLLGIAALIALLILAVEDFVQFMLGNDSVLGVMFEKAGIDAEEMRRKIVHIWENLKTIFAGVWKTITAILSPVGKLIKDLLTGIFGPEIFAGLGEGIAGVIELFDRLTTAIAESEGAQGVIGAVITGFFGVIAALKIVLPLIGLVKGSFGGLFNVASLFGKAFQGSFGGVAAILGGANVAVTSFVSMFRNGFSVVKEILMVLGIALAAVGAVILGAPATIAAVVAGIIAAVATLAVVVKEHWESIAAFFGKIGDGIKWIGDKAAQFLHLKPASKEDDKPKAQPQSDSGKHFAAALDSAGYSMDAMQARFEALGVSAGKFYDILDYANGNADTFADALYEACNAGASFEDVQKAIGVDLDELGQIMASASAFSAEKFPAALEAAGYSVDDMRARLETLGVSAEEFYDILNFADGNADVFADALYEACNAGTAFEDVQAALGVDLERLGEIMDSSAAISEERFAKALENAGYSADEMRARLEQLGVSGEDFSDILHYTGGDADKFADALYEATKKGLAFEDVEKAIGVDLEELGRIMGDASEFSAEKFPAALEKAGHSLNDMQSRFEALGVSAEDFQSALRYSKGDADVFADALYEACQAGTSFEDVQTALGVGLEELGQIMDSASTVSEERFAEALSKAGYSADDMRTRLEALGISGEDFRDILNFSGGDADIFTDALYDMCRGGVTFAEVEKALGVSLEELGQIMDSAAPDAEPFINSAAQTHEAVSGIAADMSQLSEGVASTVSDMGAQMEDSFAGAFASAGTTVRGEITETKDALKSAVSEGTAALQSLPAQSSQWGSDFMGGFQGGILAKAGAVIASIREVAGNIRSYLHFSAPDVGPLADYENWMPDFISGMASGVQRSSGNLLSVIDNLGARIKVSVRDMLSAVSTESGAILGRLPSQAFQWGADFISGLRKGIMSGVSAIVSAVRNVAEGIRSYLHFSAPDVRPLKDYERWMPDFTAGLARGLETGEDTVLEKIHDIASGISLLTQASTAAATMVSSRTSNVTQNINIDNTYNGAATDGAKSVTKAMRKSAYDATAYLARGLAAAR